MPSMQSYRAGVRVGQWTLVRRVGQGGNGEVWEATDNNQRVALKLLKATNHKSEPYKRFVAEISLLRQICDISGVLPLIDTYLPENPSYDNSPWLAMPIVLPLEKALSNEPSLEKTVEAIYSVAQTLTNLAERGISHRDIKPQNLFFDRGHYLVGDFGLAQYPGKEPFTAPGKKLGPMFFMPDEMLLNPAEADGNAADVFLLAKTLWVLATGQKYPPQGELRVDTPQVRVSSWVDHPRAYLLDRLIERATNRNPYERPRMSDITAELRAWLETVNQPDTISEMSDIATWFENASAPRKKTEELHRKQAQLADEAFEQLAKRFYGLTDKISQITKLTEKAREDGRALAETGRLAQDRIWARGLSCEVRLGSVLLTPAVAASLAKNGMMYVVSCYVFDVINSNTLPEVFALHEQLVFVGSAVQLNAINEVAKAQENSLKAALELLIEKAG